MWVADNLTHTIVKFDNGQMSVPVALIGGFMWNQGHLLKVQQPQQSLSLNNACKLPRTELVSARPRSRPLSNTDEHHHI
jgi:hypothetical protein